jgi:transcriptional regulator with XRE-family HTH domain
MEFNEKLQELRKQKGLTQEELAQALFVSRTAISKWESGRGYPSIESLKAIARFFSVTIDDLLSGDEVLSIAEEDNRMQEQHVRNLVFGLLDCSVILFPVLPFFRQRRNGIIEGVSLFSLTEIQPYLKILYIAAVFGIIVTGVLTLALQTCHDRGWQKKKRSISLLCSAAGILLFIVSLQPYAAALLFTFLTIKAFLLIKRP